MESTTLTVNSSTQTTSSKKVATHSHIRGLGLKEDGQAEAIASGFVGQFKAREVQE
jgi:RuvB-like protein 1 (pontin 52)